MTNFEMLQNAMDNLNRINNAPLENQSDIKKLKEKVAILNKAVIEIIKTLPKEQQKTVIDAVNDFGKATSQAK